MGCVPIRQKHRENDDTMQMNLSHVPSFCWFSFCISLVMHFMCFFLRNIETVPRAIRRLILGSILVLSLFVCGFSVRAAYFYSSLCQWFENTVAKFNADDCLIEVNGLTIDDPASFLKAIGSIEEVKHRKSKAIAKFKIRIHGSSETMQFELWRDARVLNEYWVMLSRPQMQPTRIGTLKSIELEKRLSQ